MSRTHSKVTSSGRWLLAWSLVVAFLSSTSKDAIVDAQSTRSVALPTVEIYMLCQITLQQEANNENNNLSDVGLQRNSTSEILAEAFEEYFVDLIGPEATSSDVEVDATIESCVASDVLQVQATASGTLNLDTTSTFSEDDLPPLVTQDSLKDGLEPLCESVLRLESTIKANDEPESSSSRLFTSEGWATRLSTAVCGLTEEEVGLSLSVILVISIAVLVVLCGICCCCCRRNRKS